MSNFLKKYFSPKYLKLGVFFLVVGVLVGIPQEVGAGYWVSTIAEGVITALALITDKVLAKIAAVLIYLFFLIAVSLSDLVLLLLSLMLDENLWSEVLNGRSIEIGWRLVRDFCNIFYIFFLLLMAFATILRVQAYSVKNLLPKFVLSIFLVNFSAVIAKIVIDVGQIFFFGMQEWISGGEITNLNLNTVIGLMRAQISELYSLHTGIPQVCAMAVLLIFMVTLLLTYISLTGFLLIRLITFVFLIIVSPFAFFSMVLPSMQKYQQQWWTALISNSISAAVLIFFVGLANTMMIFDLAIVVPSAATVDHNLFARTISTIIPYIIPLGVLLAAFPATKTLGAIGANATLSLGKAAMASVAVGRAGYQLGRLGDRALGNPVSNTLNNSTAKFKKYTRDVAKQTGKEWVDKGGIIKKRVGGVLAGSALDSEVKDRAKASKRAADIVNKTKDLSTEELTLKAQTTTNHEERQLLQTAILDRIKQDPNLTDEERFKALGLKYNTSGTPVAAAENQAIYEKFRKKLERDGFAKQANQATLQFLSLEDGIKRAATSGRSGLEDAELKAIQSQALTYGNDVNSALNAGNLSNTNASSFIKNYVDKDKTTKFITKDLAKIDSAFSTKIVGLRADSNPFQMAAAALVANNDGDFGRALTVNGAHKDKAVEELLTSESIKTLNPNYFSFLLHNPALRSSVKPAYFSNPAALTQLKTFVANNGGRANVTKPGYPLSPDMKTYILHHNAFNS